MPGYLFILNRESSSGENVSAMSRDINHEPPLKSREKIHRSPSKQQSICVDAVDKLSRVSLPYLYQQKRSLREETKNKV